MVFAWLKRYMPRSLYGRAALILVLPVATVSLVVSVVFVQRHFDGVSQQMSREVARALSAALDGDAQLARDLAFQIAPMPRQVWPDQDSRLWYDFSGIIVARVLRDHLDGLERVVLPDDRTVQLYIESQTGPVQVTFNRRRASAANPHQLLVNMVFFGGVMTFVAFIYLRNQLRPITRLARAAEAFGRGRTLPYSPSGAVEVRAAGHAFLDMRARIERQIEQRTLMLSGVSHDMRTPLTRLRLGLSFLDDADKEALEQDVDDLERLLEAFLEFARGEAGAGEAIPLDPVALVRGIVEESVRDGTAVRLGLMEGSGRVPLRDLSITRAVRNLVGNAVRYGTQCEVSVLLTEKALRIRVEDDGPGIPADQREAAMRPFVRLDPARNQDRGPGVGLGLSIAADIARSHGGVLRLGESERLGGLCADIVIGR